MSHSSTLYALEYEAESTFGEDVTTFATFRLPTVEPPTFEPLSQEMMDSGRSTQYRNEQSDPIPGPMGGSFTTKLDLTGHGSTTAGATSIEQIETFLGMVLGGTAAVSAASGTTSSAGTASAPTTAASGTFTAGSMCRIGALGDAKGNGQFAAISTHSGTTLNLLTAIDGAPTSSDVVYSAGMMFVNETATTTAVAGIRFRCATANIGFELHGCYPTAIAFSGLNAGERPQITITWGVSWWRYTSSAVPSAVTMDVFPGQPVAAGSFFINTVGTSTRAKYSLVDFSMDYTLGVVPIEGPGGANAYQKCVGARRVTDRCVINLTLLAEAATASPAQAAIWDDFLEPSGTQTPRHALYTLNPSIGAAVGMYWPRLKPTGPRPTQIVWNGLNAVKLSFLAGAGATTTSDLTMSMFRMAFA